MNALIVDRGTTKRDVTVTVFDAQPPSMRTTITIPAGTRCVLVENGLGSEWAVDDVALVVRLTGNTHDPIYHYVFLPADAMKE